MSPSDQRLQRKANFGQIELKGSGSGNVFSMRGGIIRTSNELDIIGGGNSSTGPVINFTGFLGFIILKLVDLQAATSNQPLIEPTNQPNQFFYSTLSTYGEFNTNWGNGIIKFQTNGISIDNNGVGYNYLSDDGTYKAITGLPAPPAGDGTYSLQVVVSGGVPTYSWV